MEHTKGKLSLNNYHYPHAYLVIRKGSDDNDAFPRPRKICDVTLDGKTEKEYEANAKELVRRWNAFEEGGIVDELRKACEMANQIDSVDNGALYQEWKKELLVKLEAALAKS